jgi:hypothetical protein
LAFDPNVKAIILSKFLKHYSVLKQNILLWQIQQSAIDACLWLPVKS